MSDLFIHCRSSSSFYPKLLFVLLLLNCYDVVVVSHRSIILWPTADIFSGGLVDGWDSFFLSCPIEKLLSIFKKINK